MQKGIGITHESNTSHMARDGQDFGIKSIIYGSGLPPVLQHRRESIPIIYNLYLYDIYIIYNSKKHMR